MQGGEPEGLAYLDGYTVDVAYSVYRRMFSTYTGNLILVERASDNTTLAIGQVGQYLDESSIISFCGASIGRVRTKYDQSGNGNNASWTTFSQMPLIYDGSSIVKENGNPIAGFSRSAVSRLRFDSPVETIGKFVYFVATRKDSLTNAHMIGSNSGVNVQMGLAGGSDSQSVVINGSPSNLGVPLSGGETPNILSIGQLRSRSEIDAQAYINEIEGDTTFHSNTTFQMNQMGLRQGSAVTAFDGVLSEFAIVDYSIVANRIDFVTELKSVHGIS